MLSGRGAFRGDDRAGEGNALAAFGATAKAGIGAARRVGAIAHGFLQVLFTNGIANTDDSLVPYAWRCKNLRFFGSLCLALQKPTFP